MSRRDEFEWLRRRIQSWNETRVELFKISLPDENGEFSGVMKFFYQYEEKDGQKVATKCIKVTSNDTVPDVIEVLVQKFRPDLKMLPNLSSYSLYEIHNESREGDVRKMELQERPLIEMIKWSKGGREGRFLLRNELSFAMFQGQQHKKSNASPSKRAKKATKNTTKEKRKNKRTRDRSSSNKTDDPLVDAATGETGRFVDTLYDNYPSSKFTRSITNPEIVRNAWSSKADKRMRSSYQAVDEIGTEEGGSGSSVTVLGGTVMPSKNIVTGNTDTASMIVHSAVERFQLGVSPSEICVVESTLPPVGGQVNGGPRHETAFERVLEDNECPVKIYTRWMLGEPGVVNRDILQFQLRHRASCMSKAPPVAAATGGESRYHDVAPRPYLVKLSTDPNQQKVYQINSFPVEIGSKLFHLNPDSHVCLPSPQIAPQHCILAQTYKGTYTIEPLSNTALVIVNEHIVNNVRPLPLGAVIKLSEQDILQFIVPEPPPAHQTNALSSSIHDKVKERVAAQNIAVDNLTPTSNDKDHPSFPTHNRTVSEHTLKSDVGVLQGDTDEGGMSSEVGVSGGEDLDKTEDDPMTMDKPANVTNIKTARNDKKRHNSAPHTGDFQFLEETPESELAVLPASISFTRQNETALLQALISEVNGSTLEFKLAPAYALYMVARHHLSSEFHPEHSRHHSLIHMIKQTCSCIKRTVKENKHSAGTLALWLSNTSELLHFLRRDYRLCMYAHEYENTLTSIIHMAYKLFTEYMCSELGLFLSAFLSDSTEADKDVPFPFKNGRNIDQISEPDVVPPGSLTHHVNLANQYWTPSNPKTTRATKPTIGCVMATLKASFSLLHQCRVNTTLSLMVFNLLFRYMSTKLLNKLVADHKCCSHSVAIKMMRRLKKVESWAVHKGLHHPVDDHLSVIIQAGTLLQVPKRNTDDINALHGLCNKLNSKQITELLNNFELAEGEGAVSVQLKEQLIGLAVQSVDQALISNGIPVKAQEKSNLQLPFLIPEQGYSCDSMRGLPVGLEEYLEHAIKLDLCHLHITKDTLGCWVPPRMTTSNQRESPLSTQASTQMSQTLPKNFSQTQNHFPSLDHTAPRRRSSEVNLASSSTTGNGEQLQMVSVKLKKVNRTLGINICEKRVNVGHNPSQLLIFIKSLSDDGPARKCGRIEVGDQILKVDSTVLNGITKQMVIKLLSNSESEVTLLIAKRASEHYGLLIPPDNSPYTDRKGYKNHESSHSIKAQRRQLREQQNDMAAFPTSRGPNMPHYHQQHTFDYHLPPSSIPSGYNQTHTARWIQEQRDHGLHKPARPTQSLNSLLAEKEDYTRHSEAGSRGVLYTDSSVTSTPPGSDISDLPTGSQLGGGGGQHSYSRKSSYESKHGRLSTVSNTSKLHDPLSSTKSNYSDYSYPSMGAGLRRPSVDSEYSNGVDMPTSLSVQMSESSDPNGSQAYPSLMMEKLSMEVGCHTQNNSSSAGLSVTNVLEQLRQKSRESKEEGGLKRNEIKGLDVDEIELEKQRMKFLFYEQAKERACTDQEGIKALDKQPPMDSNAKVSQWVNKEQDMIVEDEDILLQVDPEKLLQITNLQGKLDSLKKMVNDQRKKNREIQFAKERVKQSLQEEERKVQQAQGRNVKAFMKSEDQLKWQKDQKKRLKEWEKVKRDKAGELQHYECKEREGRSRLKAQEQYLGEIKKQLHACKGSIASRLSSATDEFGSSKLGEDIPERDWTSGTRPPRIMSIDSITTDSSILSSENPEMLKDSMSLGSDLSIPSFSEYGITPARNSPFSNRSDSSSPVGQIPSGNRSRYMYNPEIHGSMEMRPYQHGGSGKLPLTRGCSADQDKRLRMLKEEHHMHISSMDNIPAYAREGRLQQLNQLRHEAIHNIDPCTDSPSLDKNSYQHQWSKSSTNVFQYQGSIDNSNVESSLSNTPDVVPEFLVNKPLHQSSSAMSIPFQNDPSTHPPATNTSSYKYGYGRHSRPSSGFGYTDTSIQPTSYRGTRLGTSSSTTSSEYLNISGGGRVASREVLFEKPEKLVPKSHNVYSSYTNLRQRGTAADNDTMTTTGSHQQLQTAETTSRSSVNSSTSKKTNKASNSPSTHKYSHRRPDPSVNGTDDRTKVRSGHASSHSNLFAISGGQRQQTEL